MPRVRAQKRLNESYQANLLALRHKWERLFFPRTVLNETNFFVCLEYSTHVPPDCQDLELIRTRHAKVIGFIESRVKNFLSVLQFNLGGLSIQEGLIYNRTCSDLVFVPGSPFKTSELSSCFVASLPFTSIS